MINPLIYSVKLPSSHKGISIFFLVFLLGFSSIVFSSLGHIDAQGSTDCDRQTFSLVDCPGSSSGDEETDDDGQDIEEQIPSVIPFP
jgi:hypothetical protein